MPRPAALNSPNDCFCTAKTLEHPFSAFCEPSAVPADFRMLYGGPMASDRMMKAITTLERAISQLEQDVDGLLSAGSSPSSPDMDASAARAALQSLDSLITELKGRTSG